MSWGLQESRYKQPMAIQTLTAAKECLLITLEELGPLSSKQTVPPTSGQVPWDVRAGQLQKMSGSQM